MTGLGNMITHITVDESPTVGINRVYLNSSFIAIDGESNHLRKKGIPSLRSRSPQHDNSEMEPQKASLDGKTATKHSDVPEYLGGVPWGKHISRLWWKECLQQEDQLVPL